MRISGQVSKRLSQLRQHYLVESLRSGLRAFFADGITRFFFAVFVVLLLLALFGPMLTPHDYNEYQRDADGELERLAPPSSSNLLGTTDRGYDVFSRLVFGARATLLTGFVGGSIIVSIGLTIGTVSGYIGGRVDEGLMRFTDFIYGVPLIPTAIVFVAYFGMGFWQTIILIGALLWRGNARVFRSQVLQIKEREYVKAAEIVGGSNRHIVGKHILPNMGGMIVLFFALGTGATILIDASLAFLGMTSPFIPSWGIMLQNVYNSGAMTDAWWWTIPPGFMIGLTVLTIIMLGRGYERMTERSEHGVEV